VKTCFFIGHREASSEVLPALTEAVAQHIVEYGVTEFIVGNYGGFDRMAAKAVIAAKKTFPNLVLSMLIPYHPAERPIEPPHGFDNTFYPPGMEKVPRKLAIVRANRYMVDHCLRMASGKQRTRARRVRKEKRATEPNIRNYLAKELICVKRKTGLIIAVICFLLVLAVAIIRVPRSAPKNEMTNMRNQTEDALGDERTKQAVTEVSDLIYSDNEGNTIVYHVCITTYYEAVSTKQTGLNTEAIAAVIAPDEAESYRECAVSGLPAAIYQKEGRAYLC